MINDKDQSEDLNKMARQYPIVKFGNDEYYCDTRNHEFNRKSFPYNSIKFETLLEINDRSSFLFYDLKKHDAIQTRNLYKELPKNVLLIRLPPIKLLDPVGFAIWNGLEKDAFLTQRRGYFNNSDKYIQDLYQLNTQITRVTPKFGYLDKRLKENKLKSLKK